MNKTYAGIAGLIVGVVLGAGYVVSQPEQQLGAISSPDILSPYFSYGGVRHWAGSTDSLAQATTTVCAIQSPAATSTLEFASVKLSVSSSTASIVHIAKASTAYATTTLLGLAAVSANAQDTVIASTSPAAGEATIFAPNTYLVVGMQGGVGTFSPTGRCSAVWQEN